ncbi:MAG: hypothetical protein KJ018_09025 [Burkholderiales bacterium]|nr:hypothetical protein [Burkholderiales bacterium]
MLENEHVRLRLVRRDGYWHEIIEAYDGDWCQIAEGAPPIDGGLDVSLQYQEAVVVCAYGSEVAVSLVGRHGERTVRTHVALRDGESVLRYRVTEELRARRSERSFMAQYRFSGAQPDFSWAPHLRPRHNDVVGQFAFKSPAIIMQEGTRLVSLIADVGTIRADAVQPVCFEPDVRPSDGKGALLAYGFKHHAPHGLIFFRHDPDSAVELAPGHRELGYLVQISARAEPAYGYREVVRTLWREFGSRSFAEVDPQVMPIDRYGDYALNYALPELWRDMPSDGVARGGMLMGIKFPNDIWFHFFFNHLHTAFGLHLMGQRRGRPDLVKKARRIKELCLSAPTKDGAFPAIHSHQIINGIRRERWIPHAHWVGGTIPYQTQIPPPPDQPAFSTMDLAWTAYWMIRWNEEIEQDSRLLERAAACGDLLLRSQLRSGAIPVWLHHETLEPVELLRESPSAAAAGLLLAKLDEVTGDARYLQGATRVAEFIESRVMPQRWADYESFFDSCGKAFDLFDPYSGQTPQNTFPMFWTAEMGKVLFRTTGDRRYLLQAERAIDYLLLFQGVWSPPYLTVKGFGSVGIGNGHTGWNDARAGIFAPGIAEFYELTGNDEYLARGVAAMRAPLALMYVPENEAVSSVFDKGPLGYADECYAHRGRDARLGPSTFDFSVGYALMAFEELVPRYGSAVLDLENNRGVGIDGCSVESVEVLDNRVRVTLKDRVQRESPPDIRIRGEVTRRFDIDLFSV